MRYFATFCLLVSIGFLLMASSGCLSKGKWVMPQIDTPMALANATGNFKRETGRWPHDYAELCSSEFGSGLTNYSRADFTQKADGSLEIYAVGPSMTNQMTCVDDVAHGIHVDVKLESQK